MVEERPATAASNAALAPKLTAVVTGATSGLGREIAEALAAAGAAVGIVARDAARGAATKTAIDAVSGSSASRVFMADLSRPADVRQLAADVLEASARLDILVHCAAVYTRHRTLTADGLESMFATNQLAPFLLTNLLRDRLVASAPARVLIVTAPAGNRIDFDDLTAERGFSSLPRFGASKAADLLLTREFARRFEATGVTVNAVHPGLVKTDLMTGAPAFLRWGVRLVSAPPAKAAAAITPLLLAPDYATRSGLFFKDGKEIDPPAYTRDADEARRLWDVDASLVGLARDAPA
ncbi:MAG TPA: SDR family NAD(P)-dependent oxidoreductase [Candidatus Limnocylindrales bacterium]|nr:SDR family NAD(P)-dependent oxidoreductase [Candidatus Limnocylindrales bacterium]